MCTVLLPPGDNPIAVNKYHIIYLEKNTANTYLCNLAGTDYELPEDEVIASKHVGAV